MLGIGIGVGLAVGLTAGARRTARVKKHLADVSTLVESGELLDLGTTTDQLVSPEILSPEDLFRRIHLPEEYRERIVRVGTLPFDAMHRLRDEPRLLHELEPRQFEMVVAELLANLGFNDVLLTSRSCDGGRDVVASRVVSGIPVTFFFECKKYRPDRRIGVEIFRALLGSVVSGGHQANKGVLVTTSTFTQGSLDFVAQEKRLDGKDYQDLVGWMHEAFPSEK